jgi:hypothetical protein
MGGDLWVSLCGQEGFIPQVLASDTYCPLLSHILCVLATHGVE